MNFDNQQGLSRIDAVDRLAFRNRIAVVLDGEIRRRRRDSLARPRPLGRAAGGDRQGDQHDRGVAHGA